MELRCFPALQHPPSEGAAWSSCSARRCHQSCGAAAEPCPLLHPPAPCTCIQHPCRSSWELSPPLLPPFCPSSCSVWVILGCVGRTPSVSCALRAERVPAASLLFAFLLSGYAELKLLLIPAASPGVCLRPVPEAESLPWRAGWGSCSCFSSRCQVWKEFVAC